MWVTLRGVLCLLPSIQILHSEFGFHLDHDGDQWDRQMRHSYISHRGLIIGDEGKRRVLRLINWHFAKHYLLNVVFPWFCPFITVTGALLSPIIPNRAPENIKLSGRLIIQNNYNACVGAWILGDLKEQQILQPFYWCRGLHLQAQWAEKNRDWTGIQTDFLINIVQHCEEIKLSIKILLQKLKKKKKDIFERIHKFSVEMIQVVYFVLTLSQSWHSG